MGRYLELVFEEKDCPWTPNDVGDSVESPLEDGHGIHAFAGAGHIVLWERLTYDAAHEPFVKITVQYGGVNS